MANANFYNVELRDKSGNLRQYLTPFITKLKWEWSRIGGCGRCQISLGMAYRKIEFSAGDDIQIRLRSGSTSKLVYRGWISGTGPTLKKDQEILLDVRGYFSLLDFMVVHDSGAIKTYTGQGISAIVDDIADTFITANSSITKGTIDTSSFAADTLEFKTKVSTALRTLAELEGKVEYGVDEDLAFFWRTESDTINRKFFVGDNVEILERKFDWSKLLNKIYFEGGEVDGVKFETTAEVSESQTKYFLAEGIISNSSITTTSVADRFLASTLREKSSPILNIRAKIVNTNIRLEDTIPMGKVAVVDYDYDDLKYTWGTVANGGSGLVWGTVANGGSGKKWGGFYSSQVNSIAYSLAEGDEKFNIELTFGGSLLETSAKIKQIEQELSSLRQK